MPDTTAAASSTDTPGTIGVSVTRLEDRALLTGTARFVDDIRFDHQLSMRVVRSAHAHGRIVAIDTSAAAALPGVAAVWTAEDIAHVPPVDFRDPSAEALLPYRQPVLARGMVRYVGEPVAIVLAEDPYVAEDAANLVGIEVEPLPVIVSALDTPGIFDGQHRTEATVQVASFGDIERAFAAAHTVVSLDLDIGRHSGVPLETRGAIGVYDAGRDLLELYGAAKVPHRNRDTLVRMLDRTPSSLHLHEGHTGGGFGVRGELYPEDVLVLVAAERMRRPVKWIEDRREHLIATNHSRQQHHKARLALAADGRMLGLDITLYHDQGAYIRTHGARVLNRTLISIPGPYRIGAYRAVGHFRLTNKTPAATYRAPGGYESTFVRERLIDAAAARLGIDGVELRKRNLVTAEEMPFTRPFNEAHAENLELDSGDYAGLLDKALASLDWPGLQGTLAARRAKGELVGAGLSVFFDESGRGPADGARATIDTMGSVELITGGASVGQGFETAMAQICANELGVGYDRIRVIHGQTDRIPYGIGAHASRATVLTGNAVGVTARKLRQKVVGLASELLQTPAEALTIVDGVVRPKSGALGPSISVAELAQRVAPGSKMLGDRDPGLIAEGWYNTDQLAFSYGVHVAVVRVDRETGGITIERYVVAQEVGRAVNPMLVKGQILGGALQGIGGALYEEFAYTPDGEPLSVTFADYIMATTHEAPRIDVIVAEDSPSPFNPLGLKGAGEGGINGAGAAIAGAVDAALGRSGAAVRLPLTPTRVRALVTTPEA